MAGIVLKQTSSGGVIQEMDSSDRGYISHVVLTDFYESDASVAVGTVSVNPVSTVGLTAIGSFVDTRTTNAIGNHDSDATSITTVSTSIFYQNLGSASESITDATRPLALDNNVNPNIKRMSDSELNDGIIFDIQQDIYEGGVGSYVLQPSAPTSGTWLSKGSITNTLTGGSPNTSNLWRKSAPASTPATVRPMKYVAGSGSLREMTYTEIKKLTPRLRNRIVANGIGQYKFQSTAPDTGGTWIQAGEGFVDTRRQITSENYAGFFSSTFSATFTNTFTGFFSATYNRFHPFAGYLIGSFSGSRTKFFTGSFTGFFTGTFTQNFAAPTVQSSTENITEKKLWVRTA